jgi:hypothetical protein
VWTHRGPFLVAFHTLGVRALFVFVLPAANGVQDDENEDYEDDLLHVTQATSRRRKRSSNMRASSTSTSATPKKKGGAVWPDGRDEHAYDAGCVAFLNFNLEARTRARAAAVADLPYRPQSVMELLGVAADSVVMGVSGPERATDPNEDIYKAAHEAWLGTNQEKENQRWCLVAKLDHARDDLGNYYPSLPVLAALEPHHERERVCPNAAAGCPVVGKPARKHTCKFLEGGASAVRGRNVVIFQEGSAFAPAL